MAINSAAQEQQNQVELVFLASSEQSIHIVSWLVTASRHPYTSHIKVEAYLTLTVFLLPVLFQSTSYCGCCYVVSSSKNRCLTRWCHCCMLMNRPQLVSLTSRSAITADLLHPCSVYYRIHMSIAQTATLAFTRIAMLATFLAVPLSHTHPSPLFLLMFAHYHSPYTHCPSLSLSTHIHTFQPCCRPNSTMFLP